MWEFSNPTHYFALNSNLLKMKIDGYLQHKTQYPDPSLVVEGITFVVTAVAQNINIKNVSMAEGFIAYY